MTETDKEDLHSDASKFAARLHLFSLLFEVNSKQWEMNVMKREWALNDLDIHPLCWLLFQFLLIKWNNKLNYIAISRTKKSKHLKHVCNSGIFISHIWFSQDFTRFKTSEIWKALLQQYKNIQKLYHSTLQEMMLPCAESVESVWLTDLLVQVLNSGQEFLTANKDSVTPK